MKTSTRMINKKIINVGILIVIFYWIAESLIHLVIFGRGKNLIQVEKFFLVRLRELKKQIHKINTTLNEKKR